MFIKKKSPLPVREERGSFCKEKCRMQVSPINKEIT